MLKKQFLETIKEYKMLNPGDSVVIGVSGGADSVSLLNLFNACQADLEIKNLYVAHLNHQLRKGDAELDQKYVENLARSLNIPCFSESLDVEAYAVKNKLNLENAGRNLRYEHYYQVMRQVGANRIALGHTADDNVETFLMRLLRGAGLKGLRGIPAVRSEIIRPLLKIWRKDIDKYINSLKLVPRIDHTNYESKYLRNQVRHKLIPQLKIYNLNIKEILLQTILLLTEDYLYFEGKVNEALNGVIQKQTENMIEINALGLRPLESSVQGHLIRGAIEKVKGNLAELAFSHIHGIIKNLGSTENWELHLPDKIYAFGKRNTLILTRDKPELPEKISYIYKFPIPGEIYIDEVKTRIRAEVLDKPKDFKVTGHPPHTAIMDFEQVGKELLVRSRKDGDRFIPFGMRGTKKIHDFLIDQKVPQEDRDYIPIVEAEQRIVWLAGYRIDERVKVKKKTTKVLRLTTEKL